jgi:dephospho-CoA kinase
MRRIGLTGGIATGKTYVAARLVRAGVPLIDADVAARAVVRPGTAALAAIVERFGAGVLARDGTLNRPALGSIVFADVAARRDLEAIVHPAVQAAIEAYLTALPPDTPFAVADIPLLFETGREAAFDLIVVVACARETQIARIMTRDGLPRADAERRLAAQWPIESKVERADVVIWTDGSFADTDAQVDALLTRLRADASVR